MRRREVLLGGAALALSAKGVASPLLPSRAEWTFDNLERIGGHPVTVAGAPRLTESPWGPAVLFDGRQDAIFIDEHPLAGARTFSFEALFRPDGGAFAQRWFHLETVDDPALAPGSSSTRILFEIRVTGGGWYLDAFATGEGYKQALMVPTRTYPIGRWYHVAQTFDGKMYPSFVNGEEQLAMPLTFTPQGPGRCAIGMRLNHSDPFFGAVRMARFSNAFASGIWRLSKAVKLECHLKHGEFRRARNCTYAG